MRMTVERSIPKRSAASLWLSSPVTSCNHSSYFWLGLRNRLARRPRRSRPESCWVISTLPLEAGGPYRMRRNHNPDVGHEVRRKTDLWRQCSIQAQHAVLEPVIGDLEPLPTDRGRQLQVLRAVGVGAVPWIQVKAEQDHARNDPPCLVHAARQLPGQGAVPKIAALRQREPRGLGRV